MKALSRFAALLAKECTHAVRDPSGLVIGLFLPVAILFIFGYGLSMDIKDVRVALVTLDASSEASALTRRLTASPTFVVKGLPSRQAAEAALERHEVEAALVIPDNFSRALTARRGVLELTVNGVDANAANLVRNYVEGALAAALPGASAPATSVNVRARFNETNDSTLYLVPGLFVVSMMLVGSFLTSLVVAREWERGTAPALLATPARTFEILSAKLAPSVALALTGHAIALVAALAAFSLPIRGSLAALALFFVLVQTLACAFGLWLSALLRQQFLANQYALIGSFLPALMLSGFIFDLRSVPEAIGFIGRLMPTTYAVEAFKICFLSGGSETRLFVDALVLAGFTALFSLLAAHALSRSRTGG